MEPFLVGFGASGVGFGAAMWGSEPLMCGSEVSLANNGVRRSEMWGSWPPSPPTLVGLVLFEWFNKTFFKRGRGFGKHVLQLNLICFFLAISYI